MVTGKTGSYTVNESIDYDALLRKTDDGISLSNGNTTILPYNKQYTYTANDYTVSSVSFKKNGTGTTFSYTYDTFGNITEVYENNALQASYVYDDLGQLVRENNAVANQTWVYTYDVRGNITGRYTYAYTTGALGTLQDTDTYEYPTKSGTPTWMDLLIKYNGNYIVYDAIGNPTSYYNGSSYSFTWSDGRKLTSGTKGTTSFSYVYNAEGLRTRKVVGTKTYDYYWDGSQLSALTISQNNTVTATMQFLYSASGEPLAFNYNGTLYIYETNLQGDVTGLCNSYGRVAFYKYDAWGNVVDCDAAGGNDLNALDANPLRYRGYIYDTETGFYYLQSRYYDPTVCRFINGDGQLNGGFLGYNQFAYCENNPIMYSDPNGQLPTWAWIALGVAAAAAAVALCVVTYGAAAPGAICALTAMGTSIGISYATASAVATAAVVTAVSVSTVAVAEAAYTAVVGEGLLESTIFQNSPDAYATFMTAGVIATFGVLGLSAISPGVCFVAGTLIATEEGNSPIETVRPGDYVWAYDEETGETALKEVVQLFRNETNEWIHLTVNGEEIVCTNEHPFYVPQKGWTAACQLRAGDILVTVNGEYVVVEQIQHELLESPETTYNFEVAEFHTYYVGDTEVLVHNTCSSDYSQFSTGRTEPQNLIEKLSMESAQSNPRAGREIISILNDPRLPEGAVKMSQTFTTSIGKISIHYIWDKVQDIFFDFKFI